MFELMLCSLLTILPDYLFRRYVQDKRIGREITIYSVWFELRWGIIACLLLTVSLITLIFYYHPATQSAVSLFRTVPILPEGAGRVAEVYVGVREEVEAGQPLFKLDSSEQEAALETARQRIEEIEAGIELAQAELEAAEARIVVAEGAYKQALDELETRSELRRRNPDTVPVRQVAQLQVAVDARQGGVDEALANKRSIERQISSVLPAQKASAEAAMEEAQVALDKTVVRAGVDGMVEQFTLRVGDIVNPFLRPAGILVPSEAGRLAILAGFKQIEAQVMQVGMAGEAACISKPFEVIPLVVTEVQDVIAAGQLRPTDQLMDVLQVTQPGSLTVFLEPLYEGATATARAPDAPERRYALRLVKQRLHQAAFRDGVLAAYDHRCAISNLPEDHLLDAAHIMADPHELLGQPVLANGIALSKIHHAAFDNHLIGIDPDGRVHVSERLLALHDGPLLEQSLKAIAGRMIRLPRSSGHRPDRDRLASRFELFKRVA